MLFEGPMHLEKHAIATPWVRRIHLDYRTVLQPVRRPALLVLHGFKGFKDWGFFPWLSESFAQRGYHVLTANFSGCGVVPGEDSFADKDGFAENTISRELQEVELIVDNILNGDLNTVLKRYENWDGTVHILGHSRGGSVALLAGLHVGGIDKVVSWSAPATFMRFTERQIALWQENGHFEIQNSRTGETLKMNETYLRDIINNAETLNIQQAVQNAKVPTLLVHGTEDVTVKISELEKLMSQAHPATVLSQRIATAGHTFGAVHPFKGPTPALERAFEHSYNFLEGAHLTS